jgi:hypothetical protein
MTKALLASLVAYQLTSVACDTRDDIYKISGIKYSDNLLIQGLNTNWDDGAFSISFGLSFADVVLSAEDCVAAMLVAVVSDTFPDGTAITDESWIINPGYVGPHPVAPNIFWPPSNNQALQPWSKIKSQINGVEYRFDYSDQSVECIGKFMQVQAVSDTLYSVRFPSRPDMSVSTFWFNPGIVQLWMQQYVEIFPCAFRIPCALNSTVQRRVPIAGKIVDLNYDKQLLKRSGRIPDCVISVALRSPVVPPSTFNSLSPFAFYRH